MSQRFLLLLLLVSTALSQTANWTILNPTINFEYVLEDTERGQLVIEFEVMCDYLPDDANLVIECSAFESNRSQTCGDSSYKCAYDGSAVWIVEQKQDNMEAWCLGPDPSIAAFQFSAPVDLDCFRCILRMSNEHDRGPPSVVHLRLGCDLFRPAPGITTCQDKGKSDNNGNGKYDIQRTTLGHYLVADGDGEFALTRPSPCYLAVDPPLLYISHAPAEQSNTPSCIDDLVYQWSFSAEPNDQTCLMMSDYYVEEEPPVSAACFEYKFTGSVLCYSPRASIIFTYANRENEWTIAQYDRTSGETRILVGLNSSSDNCTRPLTHSHIAADYRSFWRVDKLPSERDASILFISHGSLWSYDIAIELCSELAPLDQYSFTEQDVQTFDADWVSLYILNRTSSTIVIVSWLDSSSESLTTIRSNNGVKKLLINVVDLIAHNWAKIPQLVPEQCMFPNVTMSHIMTSRSTANVTVTYDWDEETCLYGGKINRWPYMGLFTSCWDLNRSIEFAVRLVSNGQLSRLSTHTFEVPGLEKETTYLVRALLQWNTMEKNYRNFSYYFVPDNIEDQSTWWIYLIITFVCVTLVLASIFVFREYKARTRLKEAIQHHRIDTSHLTVQRHLGSGQFGDVFFGYYTNYAKFKTPLEVALKVSKSQSTNSANAGSMRLTSADCFFQETVALDFLKHKHIISSYGVCTNYRDTIGNTCSVLVLEYMNGGSLIDFIRANHSRLDHIDFVQILVDICEACRHLCQLGVLHRDIGARNVLIREEASPTALSSCSSRPKIIAKLTDFGLVKDVGKKMETYKSVHRTCVFHMRYTAPEGFLGNFSSQSDVWSFGVLMWELYALMDQIRQPFYNGPLDDGPVPYAHLSTQQEIFDELHRGDRLTSPESMPAELRVLMTSCWAYEPKSRPGFDQLAYPLKLLKRQFRNEISTATGGQYQIHEDEPESDQEEPQVPRVVTPSEDGYVQAAL